MAMLGKRIPELYGIMRVHQVRGRVRDVKRKMETYPGVHGHEKN
jgi:3-dehydroquinate dehydratase